MSARLEGDWLKFEQFLSYTARKRLPDLAQKIANYGVSSAVKRIAKGVPPPNAPLTIDNKGGNNTLRDTGALMASIQPAYGKDFAAWGSDLIYARIHNQGGVIVAKNGKKLCFPAGAKAKSIIARYGTSAKSVIEGMRRDGYNVWPAQSGKAIMAMEKKGTPFPLFILKNSVKIPQRKFLDIDAEDEMMILGITKDWLK